MTNGHTITIEQGSQHVRVVHEGQVVAETTRPLILHETGYPARYYLPPADVRTELLEPSDSHTVCPFKGTASYWSLPGGKDQVWAYPEPLENVQRIKDHFCFYETEVVEA
ncbi:DUF427 domain-containing protein [Streptomyces sp. NA04227]|uniref:DUF427 domain-containing protein n=1 Tax=Streptomyces sp. NA04227 TaxID=2742136 RepID=UPI0015927B07|nr:DUF427 domain-containing protein [Streptomyces sp. NA04227]QKW09338.1 DUF427 domain-containing protein [Streptomyces sp. NA04227]